MTLRTPAYLQNGAAYSASTDRFSIITPHYDLPGVVSPEHMLVTQTSPASMGVTVSSGNAVVGDPDGGSGLYSVFNDGNVILTIPTANAANGRIDRIVLTVRDSDIAGSQNEAVLQVISGTPASTPTLPPLPENSIPLAAVTVGKGVSSVANNVIDTRPSVRHRAISRRGVNGPAVPVSSLTERTEIARRLGRGKVNPNNPLITFHAGSPGNELHYTTDTTTWAPVNAGTTSSALNMFGIGSPLTGSGASVDNIKIQAGTHAQKSNQYGNAELFFPKPFPRGVLTVIANQGHHAAYGTVDIQIAPTNPGNKNISYPVASLRSFVYKTVDGAGRARPNLQHRINWIALGW